MLQETIGAQQTNLHIEHRIEGQQQSVESLLRVKRYGDDSESGEDTGAGR